MAKTKEEELFDIVRKLVDFTGSRCEIWCGLCNEGRCILFEGQEFIEEEKEYKRCLECIKIFGE